MSQVDGTRQQRVLHHIAEDLYEAGLACGIARQIVDEHTGRERLGDWPLPNDAVAVRACVTTCLSHDELFPLLDVSDRLSLAATWVVGYRDGYLSKRV